MNFPAAWNAVRTRWLIVAGVTVVAGALSGILTLLQPPVYTATAEGLVSMSHPQTRPTWALANGSQYISDRMTSYAQLGSTTPVILAVSDRLGLREPPFGRVESQPVPDKALLQIMVSDANPALAARTADAVLQQLGATITRLENGNVVVTEVTPAEVPSAPSNRNITMNVAVALAAGWILGVFVAVGLQAMSDRSQRGRAGVVEPDPLPSTVESSAI